MDMAQRRLIIVELLRIEAVVILSLIHIFDTLSFAPHKFGGICGSGVLLKRSRMPLEPQMNGGASTTPCLLYTSRCV